MSRRGGAELFAVTEKELFIAICRKNPEALPVFAQCWWLDAACDNDWDIALTMKGDQVTGIWPFMLSERLSISMMRNPRLTPYLGPQVFYPPDIKESNRDSYEYDVMEQLLDALPDADVWRLSLTPGIRQAGLFRRAGLKIEVQQTFLCALDEPEEQIFQQFKEPLRRNLRAAEKELVISEEPEAVNMLFDFQKATLTEKRVTQAYTEDQMQALLDACLANGAGTLWTARDGNKIQAIVWNVWDAGTSYYFMGAKNPDTENYKAMSALLWHCIRQAKARGNRVFDFEGSMDAGVERFFRAFGARRELYLVLKRDGHWFWKLLRALRIR
jgi:hypothetical protein